MWHTFFNFLGPLVLGIFLTTAIEAISGRTWGMFIRQRFQRRASKRLRDLGRRDDLLRRGDEAMYVIEFVPDGWPAENIVFKQRSASSIHDALRSADPSHLPDSVDSIVAAILAERVRLETAPDGWWNGETVAVGDIQTGRKGSHEAPTLTVETSASDHAAATVCSNLWMEHFDSGHGDLPANLDRPIPGLLHAVGLNATLVTDDGKLLLVRRSPRADSGRDGWHVSVNEGMQNIDRNIAGRLDPHLGLVRGVYEELGLRITPNDVRFHTAMFDMRRYQFGMLGHIDLRGTGITAADAVLARKLGLSKDKFENSRLEIIPWRFTDVMIKLNEPNWVAHGWLNLLHSAIASFTPHSNALYALMGETTLSRSSSGKVAVLPNSHP